MTSRTPTKHLMEIVGMAIAELSNRQSLITVTSAELSESRKMLHIGVSVLPESKEAVALEFLKRNNQEIRESIRNNIRINPIPYVSFHADVGEKNRQNIEKLLSSDESMTS